MSETLAAIITQLDSIGANLRATQSIQITSRPTKENLRNLGTRFFSELRPQIPAIAGIDLYLSEAEKVCSDLIEASRKSPSKVKCLRQLQSLKRCLSKIEALMIQHPREIEQAGTSKVDLLICESLDQICIPAAMAYKQAIEDLSAERMSYRGPATDFREALRETLDTLAPDEDVIQVGGFKLEPDAKRPTMKQKVRFILKNRNVAVNAIQPSENAVQGVEDIIGGLVRSVYNRSSLSTHTATDKAEVLRLHAWVRIVFCEILALPHTI